MQSFTGRKFFHYFYNSLASRITWDSYQNKRQSFDFRRNDENSEYLSWPQLWGYFWIHKSWIRESITGTRKNLRRGIWSFPLQEGRVSLAFLIEMTVKKKRDFYKLLYIYIVIYPRHTLLSKKQILLLTSALNPNYFNKWHGNVCFAIEEFLKVVTEIISA